jgi:pimeloyl-ACP methyl ester carboxylesterase
MRIVPLVAIAALAAASAHAKDPWKDRYYTVSDGTKLHYVEMGKGTPVILIHGAGGSAVGNWFNNGLVTKLAKTNRVIGIDMRGHALSEAGPAGSRVKMPDDVLEFMRQQKIEKAHIGGYSMGGGVTLSLLARHPEKFITAHFGGSGVTETEEWRDKVPADLTGEAADEQKARDSYNRIQAERGREVGNNAAAMRRTRSGDNAAAPAQRPTAPARPPVDLSNARHIPVLAVNGDHDRPIAKTHRLWREFYNFQNVVLPGKGHLSAVMAGFVPPEYVKALTDFVVAHNP